MTVLIKYPRVTKEVINDFIKRKNKELTSLDWAKWAGWFDTDGSFSIRGKGKKDDLQQPSVGGWLHPLGLQHHEREHHHSHDEPSWRRQEGEKPEGEGGCAEQGGGDREPDTTARRRR